jgi:hypothetical protein
MPRNFWPGWLNWIWKRNVTDNAEINGGQCYTDALERSLHMRTVISILMALCLAVTATVAGAYDVGDSNNFWVWDLSVMPPADTQIAATCRGVGDYGYVFVEDAAWNATEMDQADVDAVLAAFENETPAGSYDSAKGIFEVETELFGMPTQVDGDPKVVLLYYNLQCFEGTCFDGFFRNEDLGSGPNSNETEMLHLNINDYDPTSDYMLGIVAHEFNHMIHSPIDPNEPIWFSEAMAEAAMITCGYFTDTSWLTSFLHNSDVSFWGDEHSVHYGAALLIGTYLYETIGASELAGLIADPDNGVTAIEKVLVGQDFAEFFAEMALAILLDGEGGDHEYDSIDVGVPSPSYSVLETGSSDKTILAGSIHYVRLEWFETALETFGAMIDTGKSLDGLNAFLVAYYDSSYTVEAFPENGTLLWDDDSANAIDLVIVNSSSTEDIQYTLTVGDEGEGDDDDDDDDAADDDDDDDAASDDDDDDDDDGGCCG